MMKMKCMDWINDKINQSTDLVRTVCVNKLEEDYQRLEIQEKN